MNAPQNGRSETFNARFLNPREVGQTFVVPPFLHDIAAPNNTAILGPRGSGKTTLLKMLTLPALLGWSNPEREVLAGRLDYLSIYIPSSLTWNADYRRFAGGQLPEDVGNLVSISLFRHNVLFSLLNTWIEAGSTEVQRDYQLGRFSLPIASSREAQLVRDIARQWELSLPIASIGGLREAISDRLRLLQKLSVHAAHVDTTVAQLLDKYDFLSAHLLDDCSAFADFISTSYQRDLKFALCFDEVEIAPDAIADAIIRMPRSIDQRFLVKFSAAPYVGVAAKLKDSTAPTQREDYRFVLLSSFSSKETRKFSEALFNSVAVNRGIQAKAADILGPSLIDEETAHRDGKEFASPYRARGAYQRRFAALVGADASFSEYVEQKQINVHDLSQGTENERAALIRKIIWPVLIREEFLFRPEKPSRRRLRSATAVSDIYTGAGSLFAVCEGNPRQIIGLMEPMLRNISKVDATAKIKRSVQKQMLERTISAYFALVSTVPINTSFQNVHSLVDMVSIVGSYFRETVLGRTFNPDPVLSFEVDANLPASIKELVGRGINLGAFVLADVTKSGESPYRLGDITGLKARLSNMFAPHFRLPLASGRTLRLSTILKRAESTQHSQPLLELFGEKI
jgi:hypothetical protein